MLSNDRQEELLRMAEGYKQAVYQDLLDYGLTVETATEFMEKYYNSSIHTWNYELNSEALALRIIQTHRNVKRWFPRQEEKKNEIINQTKKLSR